MTTIQGPRGNPGGSQRNGESSKEAAAAGGQRPLAAVRGSGERRAGLHSAAAASNIKITLLLQ